MGQCENTARFFAREAIHRMSSGFWKAEYSVRRKKLTVIKSSGGNTNEAIKFFAERTKSQIVTGNDDDEKLYMRARQVFLSVGVENALSSLIDKSAVINLTDPERQRYVFNLSEKLQKFKDRFVKETEYNLRVRAV
jgi:hypothetical protein